MYSEEQIRGWTNQRVRAGLKAGRSPGPETSIGKVHQGELNQRIQLLATDLLGRRRHRPGRRPVRRTTRSLPYEVKGMLRSRANTIEGGTTEVNKNVDRRAGARPAPRARPVRTTRRGSDVPRS